MFLFNTFDWNTVFSIEILLMNIMDHVYTIVFTQDMDIKAKYQRNQIITKLILSVI